MIGDPGASVPDVAVDLGVADIFISDQAQTIRYAGKGLSTDVGAGVPGPAQGMTIESSREGISRPDMTDYYPQYSVSRPHIAKTEKPVRGATSVRGINRPKIAEDTQDMLDFGHTALDELGPEGTFDDEDPNWLQDNAVRRVKNRARMRKTQPRRGRNSPSTILGGVRV